MEYLLRLSLLKTVMLLNLFVETMIFLAFFNEYEVQNNSIYLNYNFCNFKSFSPLINLMHPWWIKIFLSSSLFLSFHIWKKNIYGNISWVHYQEKSYSWMFPCINLIKILEIVVPICALTSQLPTKQCFGGCAKIMLTASEPTAQCYMFAKHYVRKISSTRALCDRHLMRA